MAVSDIPAQCPPGTTEVPTFGNCQLSTEGSKPVLMSLPSNASATPAMKNSEKWRAPTVTEAASARSKGIPSSEPSAGSR